MSYSTLKKDGFLSVLSWLACFCWMIILAGVCKTQESGSCDAGHFQEQMDEPCTNYTCNGTCLNDRQCCTEKCYDNDTYVSVCSPNTKHVNCSLFEQYVQCMSVLRNKTFNVCWKQIMSHLQNIDHIYILNFNPLLCPCEIGYVRRCIFPDCANDTESCLNVTDSFTGKTVCCVASVSVKSNVIKDASPPERRFAGGFVAMVVGIICVLAAVGAFTVCYILQQKKKQFQKQVLQQVMKKSDVADSKLGEFHDINVLPSDD